MKKYCVISEIKPECLSDYIKNHKEIHKGPYKELLEVIKKSYPKLLPLYQELRRDRSRWDLIENNIRNYCENNDLNFRVEFHHGGFSKS